MTGSSVWLCLKLAHWPTDHKHLRLFFNVCPFLSQLLWALVSETSIYHNNSTLCTQLTFRKNNSVWVLSSWVYLFIFFWKPPRTLLLKLFRYTLSGQCLLSFLDLNKIDTFCIYHLNSKLFTQYNSFFLKCNNNSYSNS